MATSHHASGIAAQTNAQWQPKTMPAKGRRGRSWRWFIAAQTGDSAALEAHLEQAAAASGTKRAAR